MELRHWRCFVYVAFVAMCLTGCFATENLVHVPAHSAMANVDDYDTTLHQQSVHIFSPMPIDARVAQLRLQPRVAHLILMIDQSAALDGQVRGLDTRFYAREILRRFIKTMPNASFSATIVTYRNSPSPQTFAPMDARLGVSSLFPSELERHLGDPHAEQLIAVPTLPLALDHVSELVGNLRSTAAVVLVTAWSQINEAVEQAVMRMRQRARFGSDAHVVVPVGSAIDWPNSHAGVCFYTIGVGNQLSRSRLQSADSCGFSVALDKVAQPSTMANFVETVLYKGPADTDSDGIYDYQDRCPRTPVGRTVDYSGCPRFAAQ